VYHGVDEREGAKDCFGLEPSLQVIIWVALTDASIEAGCMDVIPGSHRLG
jgi:ectoine hydroxylase-related dioxygenase (phytanoyl-CoA dioxygenase family)